MTTLRSVETENKRSESEITAQLGTYNQGDKDSDEMPLEKEITHINQGEYTMRPAKMTDLHDAVELFETCAIHVIGTSDVSLDDIRTEWRLPKFSLDESVRVVHDKNGKMVGYIEVWDIDAMPVSIWVWFRIHPDNEDHGIGSMLLNWAENRARKALPRVPDDVQVVMESGTYHSFRKGHDRLIRQGMERIRQFLTMSIELNEADPDPRWPAAITVRTMSGDEEIEPIVRAVHDAFQDHWGYVKQPLEDSYERWRHFIQESEDFDPNLWFLAMDGDEIAGVSLCWPKANEDPEMGWVNTLGVRRPWRKQGLGLALLHHSFGVFAQRGQKRVGLGVDGASLTGATRLYDRAGMSPMVERQFDLYQKVLRQGRDISKQEM
jgi:GNAT superfamily N-acetyltransferase